MYVNDPFWIINIDEIIFIDDTELKYNYIKWLGA